MSGGPDFEYDEDLTYKVTKEEIKIFNDFNNELSKLKLPKHMVDIMEDDKNDAKNDLVNPRISLLVDEGKNLNKEFLYQINNNNEHVWETYNQFIIIWKKYVKEMLMCFYEYNPEEYHHYIDYSFDKIMNAFEYDFEFSKKDDPEPGDSIEIKLTEMKYDFIEHFLKIVKENDSYFSERKRNKWNIKNYQKEYKKFLESKKIYESKVSTGPGPINKTAKRCPKGQQKNKKTGACEEKTVKNKTVKRCPKGQRKNKKTGLCEEKK